MEENFIIPLSGLAAGRKTFRWQVGKAFFGEFDNTDIQDADIQVDVVLAKVGKDLFVDLTLDGTVTVICDRCLSPLALPVEASPRFVVRFDPSAPEMEGDREVLVAEDPAALDMRQVVYDYVYMSLPIQRVHPEGECDPETVKYLSAGEPVEEETPEETSPFAALGMLLNKKK